MQIKSTRVPAALSTKKGRHAMKTSNPTAKINQAVRSVAAAALCAGLLLTPAISSAGLADRFQQAHGKVTELKNKVSTKVDNVKEKIEALDSDGLEQLMETVGSMLAYIKEEQAEYKSFVGSDKCGPSSPCAVFRGQFRKLIESFISLPKELHFIEAIPPAVRQLEKVARLIDRMPAPILYAGEKVLGNAFEELQYRLQLVRYAALQVPRFPTMAEIGHASASYSTKSSDRSSASQFPYCTALLDNGKAHVELLTKSLEHLGDFLWDLADMMEENKTVVVNAVAGGGTSVKNPAKGTTQLIGFIIKTVRQVVELKVAATASICSLKGYQD
jgi:hypothetical protein